jgi:predicted N-acyltransferase
VSSLKIRIHKGLAELGQEAWDALVGESSPFLEWSWLQGLEQTGCVGQETGWIPRHVSLWDDGLLVAAAPAYIKLHSMGEFVYDWSFANAAQRLGVPYYPKLVVGVPFTPVTGQRLLVAAGQNASTRRLQLMAALHHVAKALGCAGLHLLFTNQDQTEAAVGAGAARRIQTQFQWRNDGYADFDQFLERFRSKRRKSLRRERRSARETGLSLEMLTGDRLSLLDLRQMFALYERQTRLYGGSRYLNVAFWDHLHRTWRHRLRLFAAHSGDLLVAGALCIEKGDRLYGRYWGASQRVPNLHFELCFYAPIEHAIRTGLGGFEPGQGGRHKFRRGFEPEFCHSAHWFFEPRLDGPIRGFLDQEVLEVRSQRNAQLAESPLRTKGGGGSC